MPAERQTEEPAEAVAAVVEHAASPRPKSPRRKAKKKARTKKPRKKRPSAAKAPEGALRSFSGVGRAKKRAAKEASTSVPEVPTERTDRDGEALDLRAVAQSLGAASDTDIRSVEPSSGDAGAEVLEQDIPQEDAVELSPAEAMALMASMRPRPEVVDTAAEGPVVEPASPACVADAALRRPARRPVTPAAACRVLTFEGPDVEPEMRVVASTLARLSAMVREGSLGLVLGGLSCGTDDFIAEWDRTPAEIPAVILANLHNGGEFPADIAERRPGAASAFWIVFETLRSPQTAAASGFLSELRDWNRLRAVGYGPRNVVEAARRGAELVRGHVKWGFGRPKRLARAG